MHIGSMVLLDINKLLFLVPYYSTYITTRDNNNCTSQNSTWLLLRWALVFHDNPYGAYTLTLDCWPQEYPICPVHTITPEIIVVRLAVVLSRASPAQDLSRTNRWRS